MAKSWRYACSVEAELTVAAARLLKERRASTLASGIASGYRNDHAHFAALEPRENQATITLRDRPLLAPGESGAATLDLLIRAGRVPALEIEDLFFLIERRRGIRGTLNMGSVCVATGKITAVGPVHTLPPRCGWRLFTPRG